MSLHPFHTIPSNCLRTKLEVKGSQNIKAKGCRIINRRPITDRSIGRSIHRSIDRSIRSTPIRPKVLTSQLWLPRYPYRVGLNEPNQRRILFRADRGDNFTVGIYRNFSWLIDLSRSVPAAVGTTSRVVRRQVAIRNGGLWVMEDGGVGYG